MPEEKDILALLPLKNVVLLPKSIIPVIVGRESSIKAVEFALNNDKTIFVSSQKQVSVENPTQEDIFSIGTKATILQAMKMPNNTLKILIEGIQRVEMDEFIEDEGGFFKVHYHHIKSAMRISVEIEALWRQVQSLYTHYAKLNDQAPEDLITASKNIEEIEHTADTIAVHLNLSFEERQSYLEIFPLKDRLIQLIIHLKKEVEILETEARIKGRIQQQVEKNQKEYYLTEQIKAIQKELGREDVQAEVLELREKIEKSGMPQDARERAERELTRIEQMPPMSSEATVSRNYIDWLVSLPWTNKTKDAISLLQAERILEKSHAGMKKAKERILEFLAAKKFSGISEKAPIICLVGPPGVGKTSLGQAVAKSLGREFVRISLGGIRDEAEIRGHRRTYIGALPGKFIQAMRKAKVTNPVILLDEIDKLASDLHGDPASALLEVLDPEQNNSFVDHFLDTEYDLSQVMFLATANHLDGIPYPLLDRMEIITLAGYTDEEKVAIAKDFLIPKKLKEYNLSGRQFRIGNDILLKIIQSYTKESGVRQLERVLAKLMRKTIQHLLKHEGAKSVTISDANIQDWLGYPKFKPANLDPKKNTIGLATGLAWTELGGEILEIEVSVVAGKGSLHLTGQLGEVMQESAHAALSYIRSRAKELGIKPSFSTTHDIHIHIPEGATPKDGPSAGITMCLALISALTKNPILPTVAMTGEITLRGRVLGVGGLKEKLLAAKRYGMTKVLVPKENFDSIQEVIKEVDLQLEIVYVETMDEVLKHALQKNPLKPARKTSAITRRPSQAVLAKKKSAKKHKTTRRQIITKKR